MPTVDVVTLALLYTIRIIAGGVATQTPSSFWLLATSLFLFFSLALMKRYAELHDKKVNGHVLSNDRGYRFEDMPFVLVYGVASGVAAVLVLALYLNSEHVLRLYANPALLGLVCPTLLVWIGHLWMVTIRGGMHDDPIVFAVKDRMSLGLALAGATIAVLASAPF
jgi:4-hydroxybenzoate polyprenyltransferase